MTSFNPLSPLQSAIIEVLADHSGNNIEDLKYRLKKEYRITISLSNLYRVVAQMIHKQILVRSKEELALNLVWVSHIINLAQIIKHNYVDNHGDIFVLELEEGQRQDFFADSLIGLDTTWNHLLLKLTDLVETKAWYGYNSHPWYALGMRETELRLYRSLLQRNIKCYLLYGNDSFLDVYGNKLITFQGFHSLTVNNSPFLKDGYCLWLCGDYIIECFFPPTITMHFAFYFQTITAIHQFSPELFADVFKMKAKCKISIRRSKKDADALLEKFVPYFKGV